MPSNYPSALDAFTNPTSTDDLDTPGVEHDVQHANANDAIEAIQATLGTNPQGVAATVAARIAAVESAGGGASALNDLTDVDTATTPPTDGQVLIWDATASQWEPGTVSGGGAAPGTMVYEDTWQSATSYQIGDVVRYASRLWLATMDSTGATPIEGGSPAFTEDFSDGVPFTSPWVLTNTPDISVIVDFTGFSPPPPAVTQALQLGGDNTETTEAQLTLSFRVPGTISFTDAVDSETNYDYGRFFIDGVEQYSIAGSDYAWTTREFNIPAGQHTFAWRYNKDSSSSAGQDAYLVANIATTGTDDPAAWTPLAVGSVLNDLTDVDTTTVAPSPGDVLTFDGTQWEPATPSGAATAAKHTFAFSAAGDLAVAPGAHRLYNDTGGPLTITAVRASVGTPPVGSSLIVDVNLNGITLGLSGEAEQLVGSTVGSNSGSIYASQSQDVIVDIEMTLLSVTFYAIEAGTYSLTIDGDVVGSVVATAASEAKIEGFSHLLTVGTHLLTIAAGISTLTRYEIGSKAYAGSGYDFSLVGWKEFGTGEYCLPWVLGVSLPTSLGLAIPAGGYTAIAEPSTSAWSAGQYLTVDIDQVGSTTPGADLTVTIVAEG